MTTASSESPDLNAIAKAVLESTEASIAGTLMERMEIAVDEVTPDRIVASMPVAGNTQPYGLLHGGASAVLAETIGSLGSAIHGAAMESCPSVLSCHAPTTALRAPVECMPLRRHCRSGGHWQRGR